MDFVFGDTTGQAKVSRVHCRCGLRSSIAAKKDPYIAHNDAEDINATHIYFAIRRNVRNMLLPYLSYSLSNDHMSSERIFVEILLNKLEQNLQLGQLHHWATSNGAEITVSNNSFLSRNLSSFSRDYSTLSRDYSALSRDYAALSRD